MYPVKLEHTVAGIVFKAVSEFPWSYTHIYIYRHTMWIKINNSRFSHLCYLILLIKRKRKKSINTSSELWFEMYTVSWTIYIINVNHSIMIIDKERHYTEK